MEPLLDPLHAIGIHVPARGERPSARYKVQWEDFVVQEILRDGTVLPIHTDPCQSVSDPAPFPFRTFNLTKRGLGTREALAILARILGLEKQDCSFHGMKDKWAVTSQLIALPARTSFPDGFLHPNIRIQPYGPAREPLRLGGHRGNQFTIRLETSCRIPALERIRRVPNFFGPQRFGRESNEHLIGRNLLEGKFEVAATAILHPRLQQLLKKSVAAVEGDLKSAFLHPLMRWETHFMLQQWQSYLFNEYLSHLLLSAPANVPPNLPLWTPDRRDGYERVGWECQSLDTDIRRLVPNRAGPRPTFFTAHRVHWTTHPTGITLRFQIPPGSYATVVLIQLFDLVEG